MSIVDVYAYLRTVASAQSTDPGDPPHSARSVLELHFFSHSWFGRGAGEAGGPILVNTLDLLAVWRLREEFAPGECVHAKGDQLPLGLRRRRFLEEAHN